MYIVRYFTLVALAAAALGVSACAKKETPPPPPPAPATTGYSKYVLPYEDSRPPQSVILGRVFLLCDLAPIRTLK
jgi:hypothetical protein